MNTPTHNESGIWTISNGSGWIVLRTDDYEAGRAYAEARGLNIYRSR